MGITLARRRRAQISVLVTLALWALFAISVWLDPKGNTTMMLALEDGVLVLLAIISTAVSAFYLRGLLTGK